MSSNPMIKVMNESSYEIVKPMTITGTINKTIILLAIVCLSGLYTWNLCATGFMDKAHTFMIIGIIASLILAIITSFKPQHSPITAPMYALCEGLAIGSISFAYGRMFDGIIQNAIGITILALLSMLLLYRNRIIQATPTFKKVIFISTLTIGLFYIICFIASFFGFQLTLFNGSALGIGVSLLICGIAAFNFIMDFDLIEKAEQNGLPKFFEWYGGFALLVTLVWLYLEVLRLLAQLNSRD